jgi:hypothetical protein
MEVWKCNCCGELKERHLFPKHGKVCKACRALKDKEYRLAHQQEYHEYEVKRHKENPMRGRERWTERNNRLRKEDYITEYHKKKKARCKALNQEYKLTPEYLKLIWTGFCPITGMKLVQGFDKKSGKRPDNVANLDRVDPRKGYIEGNVCWISNKANRMKQDNTVTDLKNIIKYMESYGVKE